MSVIDGASFSPSAFSVRHWTDAHDLGLDARRRRSSRASCPAVSPSSLAVACFASKLMVASLSRMVPAVTRP
jgi:hypothetical protein